jgi:hypothetical protein
MINTVASTRVNAADIAALRENRAKKTEPAKDTTGNTGETQKASHPAHPNGHVPPGLQRAAEKIASKIFERADANASGTVTLEELSSVHSVHARRLASSDLFQAATIETPPAIATAATSELAGDPTADATETATDATVETTPETPIQSGVTEAQFKEALTKSFYAKIGVTYASPPPPTIEPAPTAPSSTTAPSVVDSTPDESNSSQSFAALA